MIQKNDKPITLNDLSQPTNYEESNDSEFEVDWEKVLQMDQFSRKLISEGKSTPPMRKNDG